MKSDWDICRAKLSGFQTTFGLQGRCFATWQLENGLWATVSAETSQELLTKCLDAAGVPRHAQQMYPEPVTPKEFAQSIVRGPRPQPQPPVKPKKPEPPKPYQRKFG